MKKAIKNKFSGTQKLVRRVLSKRSVPSNETSSQELEESMTEEALLRNELESLKDQIANLKAAISSLQDETEHKEIAIANLAREKEKMNLELIRTKRSNVNLSQQLEDERKYYLKEKEIYCQEMNDCKKLKKMLSSCSSTHEEKGLEEYKNEIQKLKQTLNQTLEANYNLSIKFLRMKNTKTCLKTELQTMKLEHEKLTNDYKTKIENLSVDLNDLVNERLNAPISPSSKKYLQLVKQNSCLVYENLCLQLEVDNLNYKFQKFKLDRTKSETNSRLQYIHHEIQPTEKTSRRIHGDPNTQQTTVQNETPEKLEKESIPSTSTYHSSKEDKIVKIYERKERPGIPEITIINEKKPKHSNKKTKKKKASVKIQERPSENPPLVNYQIPINRSESIKPIYEDTAERCKDKIAKATSTKLALFQVSEVQSATSSDYVSLRPSLVRSRSSPDLLQNNLEI